jgi:hypothetical protein
MQYTAREGAAEEQQVELTVTLAKKAGRGLGLSVVGRRDGPGVFVSALVRRKEEKKGDSNMDVAN